METEEITEEETAEVEAPEEGAEPEATTGEEEVEKPAKGVQKRINELTYERRKNEREAEYWRNKAMELEQQTKAEPQPSSKKPTRDQYDDEDDYIEALAEWKYETKNREIESKKTQEEQQKKQQERQERLSKAVDSINYQGMQEFQDYDEAVLNNPDLQVTEAMAESVAEMENGHLVAYHLGKNPQKSREIAGKSPYAQAVALAKLETDLTAKAKKKTTKAPDPVSPVSGGGEKATKKPEDMTMDEWMDWRYSKINQR